MTASTTLRYRRVVNAVMLSATGVCAIGIILVLFFILGYLAINGARNLNLAFFTELPKPVGETGGGMANGVIGSAKILGIASLLGVPLGFLGGVYLAEYGNKAFAFVVRYTVDLLNGVPSIVVGIFAYTLIVMRVKHFSLLAGGMALGLMMIPIAVRSTEEFLRAVPNGLREGALALGTPKWRVLATVVIPAAKEGILTGIMLNLARVAGETAPLLFTSFGNMFWNRSINQPSAALPEMVYRAALSPYDELRRQAWAAGFVLLMLILIVNASARLILSRSRAGGGR